MYKVELSTDTVDMIFRDILTEDYRRICNDIERLKEQENLPAHLQGDLADAEYFRKGYEILLKYYLCHDEAESLIREMKP